MKQYIAKGLEYTMGQPSEEAIKEVEVLIDALNAASQQPNFTSLQATDKLVNHCIELSHHITGLESAKALLTVDNMLQIVDQEIWKICAKNYVSLQVEQPKLPQKKDKIQQEEYWSDFSDEDYQFDEIEDEQAVQAVQLLQSSLPTSAPSIFKINDQSGSGLMTLHQMSTILDQIGINFETNTKNALIRRLKINENGLIDYNDFLSNIVNKHVPWWRQNLFNEIFERKYKVSKFGNFKALFPTFQVRQWVELNAAEKIKQHAFIQDINVTTIVEQIFGNDTKLSKREIRHKLLALQMALTREDVHVLYKRLEKDGFIFKSDFIEFVENPTPSVMKQAWVEEPKQQLTLGNKASKELQDRDLKFQLQQAIGRIQDLEKGQGFRTQVDFSKERTLQLECSQLKSENEALHRRLEGTWLEVERLKLDKEKFQHYASEMQRNPGPLEFINLQRKIESLETQRIRNDDELKGQMDQIVLSKDLEIKTLKEHMKTSEDQFQRALKKKNSEIDSFRQELEEILTELARMKNNKI